jgi:hypothetical protein
MNYDNINHTSDESRNVVYKIVDNRRKNSLQTAIWVIAITIATNVIASWIMRIIWLWNL